MGSSSGNVEWSGWNIEMPKKILPTQERIRIDGVQKYYSHYIWFLNTGYWPVDGEVIHHIDNDHKNNEFSNLALMTRAEHISLHHTGMVYSKETRAKMSTAMMGNRNARWKGGISKDHAEYMRIWRARRRADKEGNT